MKKIFFFAAIAALALSSCSSDEIVKGDDPVLEDGAVVFSAYAGRANRATADVIKTAQVLAQKGGFGVFAYDQNTTKWSAYSATNTYPNFFYNQNVTGSNDVTPTWSYTPVKYYNNNKGALHSFFAYGPYDKDINATFSNNGPAIRYNAADQYDLLWALPTLNLEKPGIKHNVTFAFDHALTKADFEVAYFVDKVHATGDHDATETLENKTTVTLRSLRFVGNVPSQGLLCLADGTWSYEVADGSAYEFCNEAVNINKNVTEYVSISKDNFIIPTAKDVKVKVQAIYDVETVDADNPQNSSKVTNVVTSEEEFELKQATAYNFKVDLGLTSVKFNATVEKWETNTDQYVDVPNNVPYTLLAPVAILKHLASEASGSAITAADFESSELGEIKMGIETTKLIAYECTKKAVTDPSPADAEYQKVTYAYILSSDDSKIYVYGTDSYTEKTITSATKLEDIPNTAGYYKVGDNIYVVE